MVIYGTHVSFEHSSSHTPADQYQWESLGENSSSEFSQNWFSLFYDLFLQVVSKTSLQMYKHF
jgi:hypothetical protein